VQQQIHVLAAESRNIDDQRRQLNARRDRLDASAASWPRRHGPAEELNTQFAVAEEAHVVTDARLHELTDQVARARRRTSRRQEQVNAERASQSDNQRAA